jgi:hypothetical protein
MLLRELFGHDDHSRSEVDWTREVQSNVQARALSDKFGLYTREGKLIRPNLSRRAAEALRYRPDLVKKYGKIFLKKM